MALATAVVRPDHRPGMAVWRREQSSRRAMNLRDMPILLPEIPADQYRLPELVGRSFDVTVLSRDVLRPLVDLVFDGLVVFDSGRPDHPSYAGCSGEETSSGAYRECCPASSCRCRTVATVGLGPPQSKVAVCCQCWSLTPPGSPVFAYMQWESECWQCWWRVAEFNNRCSSVAGYYRLAP